MSDVALSNCKKEKLSVFFLKNKGKRKAVHCPSSGVMMMMMAGGEGPSNPNAPRPYRQALCTPF
jgi:hypothetical protein